MKTIKSIFITVFSILLAGLVISCESISNPEPINAVDSTKTVVVSGTAYANLDQTNDTTLSVKENYERAPEGTTVKVVLDAEDFASSVQAGVEYGSLTYNTTVGPSGNYSIEVPALGSPINADLYFDSFTNSQLQPDSTEEQRNYSPQSFPYTISIVADVTSLNDAIYDAN